MSLARTLAKTYDPKTVEPRLSERWQREGVYQFDRASDRPVYAIDTPPATVSGQSASRPRLFVQPYRLHGALLAYERLQRLLPDGLRRQRPAHRAAGGEAAGRHRAAGGPPGVHRALPGDWASEAEEEYRALWQRLGLSIDWRFSYRSIDTLARRTSQQSFLDLYRKGLAYQQEAPTIWCPECQTAIAQAELDDLERRRRSTRWPSHCRTARRCRSPRRARSCCPRASPSSSIPMMRAISALIGSEATDPTAGAHRARAGRPARQPGEGDGRGDVLHLWRRDRRRVVAHAWAAAAGRSWDAMAA